MRKYIQLVAIASVLSLTACLQGSANNPYSASEATANIYYSVFSARPNHLDPARSYAANEWVFIAQIYEPPYQYAYLKRPYQLEPLVATSMPKVVYYNQQHQVVNNRQQAAYTTYTIQIKPNILFQNHPAFAKNQQGKLLYHKLKPGDLRGKNILSDFKQTGTRELTAEDFVYQIKRLADPRLHSPILGVMQSHIKGLRAFAENLQQRHQQKQPIDLRKLNFEGAKVLSRYQYQITLIEDYPQFKYWLAMPFFAPVPWEADVFYNQPGMKQRNIVLDWYPVGTGPYFLQENNPNRQMVLKRNPNFHGELYPHEGEPSDTKNGLLSDAGKPLPFIDTAKFILEKEGIPKWNKFMQGYYDISSIASDNFDQAIQMMGNQAMLTPELKQKDIRLSTYVGLSSFYWGFNMLDPIVGGDSKRARKLRQAVSIALDTEEFISIFMNGRGVAAHGPIPPGIFGSLNSTQYNPVVYQKQQGKIKRRTIAYAKQLLNEAGYANGIDQVTGKPLILKYDTVSSSTADDSARLGWFRKQLAKLGIQVRIRSTHYNRFQKKMQQGKAQIFFWGWNADYPDPENFFFLLYGPNGKVKHRGENAANYHNPKFDQLFRQMKNIPNGPKRQAIITQMLQIVQNDAPWIWGFHPLTYTLYHGWSRLTKPNDVANNTLKYARIDPQLRAQKRQQWNQPIVWPILLVIVVLILVIAPVLWLYHRRLYRERYLRFKD